MSIKGVVFDLDGTLANTLNDLKDSINMAMNDLGLPEHDIESVVRCLNNGMKVFIQRAVPEELRTEEMLEKVAKSYHHYYSINYMNKTCFYDGIQEMLSVLKNELGLKLAVISNKDDVYTRKIVETLDKQKTIDVAYGFREGIPHKPSPESVFGIMEELGLTPGDTIFVGDSEVDVKTAQNAGLKCIGVLWGFKGKESFVENKPDYTVDNPQQIVDIIKNN
ncbi:MAG: HAD family hydrolase [Clostridia bacterium]|nr:HAD family hydrolase [Clostridia bacterium]